MGKQRQKGKKKACEGTRQMIEPLDLGVPLREMQVT